MAGRRHKHFRSGDLNEELGILLLKGLAAVASVPRPEDVGIDAVATLLREGPEAMLFAENSFYVQFKSSSERCIQYSAHEVRWLEKLQLPFFVGSVRKADAAIDLYATHRLSQVMLEMPYDEVLLYLDRCKELKCDRQNCRKADVGPPLLTWSIRDLARPDFSSWAYAILKPYLEAEQRNIGWRAIRTIVNIVWETNGLPRECGQMMMQNTKSVEDIHRVFASVKPHLPSLFAHALTNDDLEGIALCNMLIAYARRYGFDADPQDVYSTMIAGEAQWRSRSNSQGAEGS